MTGGDSLMAEQMALQLEEGGSIPTSPLQFTIKEIGVQAASILNAKWHSRLPIYNTGFCLNATVCYGAWFEGKWYAVAIWSNPVAAKLSQDTWLELRRMAISEPAPRFTASRMLRIMTLLIRRSFPDIIRLISYQDMDAHQGTIYKAAGWSKGSYHKGGSWNRPNAINKSTGLPRTRPDLNKSIGAKTRWELNLETQ